MTTVPMHLRDLSNELNAISGDILDAAIEVQRTLGRGLMEAAYRDCLAHELRLRDHVVEVERWMPLAYKTLVVPQAFRADLLVDARVIVELKGVPELLVEHEAQLLTYLHASGCELGLLINFHARTIMQGFRRRAVRRLPPVP